MFGNARTHFMSCYTHFGVVIVVVQAQNVNNMGSMCVWALSISFEKDELMDWAKGK